MGQRVSGSGVAEPIPRPSVREAVARLAVPTVLVVTLLTLFVGFAHKSSCLRGDFDELAYRRYCYTDIVPLYRSQGFLEGRFPYVEAPNDYPVATGLLMWTASLAGRGEGTFFVANAALLGALALLTAWLLVKATGFRALYFAAAPTLALYAFLNWDLLAVALATAGTVAFLRRRDLASGILLGLGAAAKVYPGLLLVPFAVERLREGDRRGAARIAGAGIGTWLVVNAPFATLGPGGWSYFFRFSSTRPPTPGTLWYSACRAVTGTPSCGGVTLINAASLVSFVALVAAVWRWKVRRDPSFPRWTFGLPIVVAFLLTNKVYSPQYSLWLLPWFALLMPNLRLFLLFEVADVAVFFTEFSYVGTLFGSPGLPLWPLAVAVTARAAVLVAILASYVRGGEEVAPGPVQLRAKTRPS